MQLPESMWTEDAERLERILTPLVVQAAVDGARSAFTSAQRKDAGIAVLWSLINEAVRLWAQQYAALLVRGITQTTRTAVQAAIVAWIESGEHIDALVGSMATILSPERARMIAVTETTRAYAEGNRRAWQETGATGMQWMTVQDELVCDICGELAGQRVGITEQFGYEGRPGGGDIVQFAGVPPAHPNCRCYLQPVIERPGRVELPPR